MTTYEIAGAPTPFPPQGVNYAANQSQPGAILPSYIAPNSSYGGSSYNSTGQIISTPQNPSIKTPTLPASAGNVLGSTITTPSTPISSNPSTDSGFDMKYYPGWNYNEALADWRATGGSKGRQSGGTPSKNISTKGDPRATAIVNNPQANQDFQNSGMNMDEYLAAIDQEANNQLGMLGQYEQTARADQAGIESGITSQAEQLRNKALSGKEDALSAARRLYSELQQGYKQRFGGASSAGEAAMALTQNEQQRQMAQTNRQAQQTLADIDMSATQALQSAQSEFRSRLDQINQNRTLVESQRLEARRSALMDLANKAAAIKQQQDAFKQNIALMMAQQEANAGKNISNYLNLDPTSTLTMNNAPAVASGNQGVQTVQKSVGRISSGITPDKDKQALLASGVYPLQSVMGGGVRWSDGIVR